MSPPRFNPPRCPKPASWPGADRQRWEDAREQVDILEPRRIGADWALHTRNRIESGYARWLSWLSFNDHLDPESSPGDRVTPERLARYVTALQAINAPNTVVSRIQELHLALAVIAPERDWAWIRRIESRLRRMAGSACRRRTGLVSSARLFELGLTLMSEAEALSSASLKMQAAQYRDGLMISFLAARPLRRHNFAGIQIGRHLLKQSNGYWICFEGAETKTKIPIEVPFPANLVPFLERYLSAYRPLLARCDGYWNRARAAERSSSALWLSQQGTALAEVAISGRFKKLTQDRIGRTVTMHRFRDTAATTIAIEDPEHVYITRCLLGHTTLRTSERYYNHATSLQAARRYQAGILELRRVLPDETRKRRLREPARMAAPTRSRSQTSIKGS
jgi:integrase/recombinase XerD